MVTPADPSSTSRWAASAGAAFLGFLLCGVLLYIYDDWFLNWDGSAYLFLAESLSSGQFTFPDGSWASFRGPGYPVWLAVTGSAIELGPRTAIWATRFVLAANAGLVAAWAGRVSWWWGGLASAAVVGVTALPIVSGGLFLVPDGLATGLMILALLVASRAPTRRTGTVAGFVAALAFLTKESAAVALLMVWIVQLLPGRTERPARLHDLAAAGLGWSIPVAAWNLLLVVNGAAGLPPLRSGWLWAIALGVLTALSTLGLRSEKPLVLPQNPAITLGLMAGAGGLVFAGVVLVGAPPIQPVAEYFPTLGDDLRRWLYPDAGLWWVLAVVLVTPVAMAIRRTRASVSAGLLVVVGSSLLVHASAAGLGLRNGLAVAYGLALALGVAADVPRTGRWRTAGVLTVVPLGVALIALNIPAWGHANDLLDERAHTWDADVVREAAAWLESEAGTVVGSPTFLSYMALLDSSSSYRLLRYYTQDRDIDGFETAFDKHAWWAGSLPIEPIRDTPVTLSVGRRTRAALLESPFQEDLLGAQYLLVSGNLVTIASAFDGGSLLWHAVRSGGLEPVFVSSPADLPHWIAVFAVGGPFQPDGTVVHDILDDHDPAPGEVEFDLPGYQSMILESLERARLDLDSQG